MFPLAVFRGGEGLLGVVPDAYIYIYIYIYMHTSSSVDVKGKSWLKHVALIAM
jgi:hypothetical protein